MGRSSQCCTQFHLNSLIFLDYQTTKIIIAMFFRYCKVTTVCFYHDTYASRVDLHCVIPWISSNSLLRCNIWKLSDCNVTWAHNHLARLAKWSSICLQNTWLWFRVPLHSLLASYWFYSCHQSANVYFAAILEVNTSVLQIHVFLKLVIQLLECKFSFIWKSL